jgi:MFS family permease
VPPSIAARAAPPALVRARRSAALYFFTNGAMLASWFPHIPAVKQQHALSEGELGVVLFAMAVGALLAMPLAGRLVDRFGSRRMTAGAGMTLCLALPLPIVSPDPLALIGALLALGACNGALDVSMNAQAVAVERRYGRAIMSSFHALFSLGGLVGAGFAGVAAGFGVDPVPHVVASALVGTTIAGLALRGLLPAEPDHVSSGSGFAWPTRTLAGLGLLAFFGLLAEGAMADWSAVYLRDSLGASMSLAAAGFAAFSLTMAAGRFGGDRLVARFGPGAVLRLSSALAAAGLGVALAFGNPVVAIVGCGAVGLGIANVIPVLFSSAGKTPDVAPGPALATVATIGYLGFLAGPPLIGVAAELTSLPIALGIVSAFCALITIFGRVVESDEASVVSASERPTGWVSRADGA